MINSQIIIASAGTGKTFTLIDRILYLLLINNSINKILIITFTNAAIEEIHARLHITLKNWQNYDDIVNKDIIIYKKKYNINQSKEILIQRAKNLFNEYISNIEKIQIKTIHAFCAWILSYIAFDKNNKFKILTHFDLSNIKIPKEIYSYIHFSKTNELIYQILNNQDKFNQIDQNNLKPLLYKTFLIDHNITIPKLQNLIVQKYKIITKEEKSYQEIFNIFYTQTLILRKKIEPIELKTLELYFNQIMTLETINNTIVMQNFIQDILAQYKQYKAMNSYIDYNDIITKTFNILNDKDKYYLYQIYNAFDHILIDEAQDTSMTQWKILIQIIKEIEQDENKSFFIVGDSKQSIFGFQGSYQNSMQDLIQEYKDKNNIDILELNKTYRNSQNIIRFVNKIFSSIADFQYNTTYSDIENGTVEIILCPKIKDNDPTWPVLFSYKEAISSSILAIYDIIQKKIKANYQLSDIMIIFQKRNNLYFSLIKFLQNKKIPCQNPDKEIITENKFIQQLIYIYEFVLNNENNFALLQIIMNKKILSIREIEDLCRNRKDKILWNEIKNKYYKLYLFLDILNHKYKDLNYEDFIFFSIDQLSMFKYFNNKIINTFIDISKGYCSIYELLNNLYNYKNHLKQNSNNKDEIQILTSHGSKGLEAKVIILADTNNRPNLLNDFLFFTNENTNNLFLWNYKMQGSLLQEIKNLNLQKQYTEYIRLLYVSITRAKQEFFAIINEEYKEDSWANILLKNSDNKTKFIHDQNIIKNIKANTEILPNTIKDIPYIYMYKVNNNLNENQALGILIHKILNKILNSKSTIILDKYLESSDLKYKHNIQNRINLLFQTSPLIRKAIENNNIFLEHKIYYNKSFIQIDLLIKEKNTIYLIDFKLEYKEEYQYSYKKQLNLYHQVIQEYFQCQIKRFIICLTSFKEINI